MSVGEDGAASWRSPTPPVNTEGQHRWPMETHIHRQEQEEPSSKWTKDVNKQCPKIKSRQMRIWEGVHIPKQLRKCKLR